MTVRPSPHLVHTAIRISTSVVFTILLAFDGAGSLFAIDALERFTYDLRVRWTLQSGTDTRIVIIAIDELSLLQEGQWPWPRERLATLIDTLFDTYHVRLVAFDMVFPEPERSTVQGMTTGDARFAQSLQKRPVVLGYTFAMAREQGRNLTIGQLPPPIAPLTVLGEVPNPFAIAQGHVANRAIFQENARAGGFLSSPLLDQDGVLRRVPLLLSHRNQLYDTLSIATIRTLLGQPTVRFISGGAEFPVLEAVRVGALTIPIDAEGAVWVPFRAPQGHFPYLSAHTVLNQQARAEDLEGAIVLIGATATGLLDWRATPVQNVYPGVEVHANLMAGILDQQILHRPVFTRGLEKIMLCLIGFLSMLLSSFSPLIALIGTLVMGMTTIGFNLYAWQALQTILPLASPLVLLFLLYLWQSSYSYFVQNHRARQLTTLFGQYVPPTLVAEMSSQPGSHGLGGESREMTVLFSDIQDFTTVSEGLEPRELAQLMRFILTPMTQVIHEHRGTVDKYIGDAIMAFWGAPLPDSEHARHAVLTALALKAQLAALAPALQARGWPTLRIRVGVNTGVMNVGNMGSAFRMAYTVLGDAVNLAARLESAAKQYGATLVISETTRAAVPDIVCRELDRVRVKGRTQPVTIFEPLVGPMETITAPLHAALQAHQTALQSYRTRDFAKATAQFQSLHQQANDHTEQRLYQLYLDRIAALIIDPPPSDWDGVFTLHEK